MWMMPKDREVTLSEASSARQPVSRDAPAAPGLATGAAGALADMQPQLGAAQELMARGAGGMARIGRQVSSLRLLGAPSLELHTSGSPRGAAAGLPNRLSCAASGLIRTPVSAPDPPGPQHWHSEQSCPALPGPRGRLLSSPSSPFGGHSRGKFADPPAGAPRPSLAAAYRGLGSSGSVEASSAFARAMELALAGLAPGDARLVRSRSTYALTSQPCGAGAAQDRSRRLSMDDGDVMRASRGG
jgi:hypothetical protein